MVKVSHLNTDNKALTSDEVTAAMLFPVYSHILGISIQRARRFCTFPEWWYSNAHSASHVINMFLLHQPSTFQTTSGDVPEQFQADTSGGSEGESFVRQLSWCRHRVFCSALLDLVGVYENGLLDELSVGAASFLSCTWHVFFWHLFWFCKLSGFLSPLTLSQLWLKQIHFMTATEIRRHRPFSQTQSAVSWVRWDQKAFGFSQREEFVSTGRKKGFQAGCKEPFLLCGILIRNNASWGF